MSIHKHEECEICVAYHPENDCSGMWEYHHDNGQVREGHCEPRRQYTKLQEVERLFESSKLTPRFKQRTFDTYKPSADTQTAYEACKAWGNKDHSDGLGLLLNGPVGTGKTHLVAGILNEWLESGKLGVFVVVSDLFGEIRSAMNTSESSDAIIDRAAGVPLLVLDDLGVDRATEWQSSTIYRIINHRYEHFLPTIITTNLELGEIRDKLGLRTCDRLLECCEWWAVGGSSHREKIARARRQG